MRKYVKPEVDIIEFGMVDIFMSGETPQQDEGDKTAEEEPKDEPAHSDGPEIVDGATSVPTVSPEADDTESNGSGGAGGNGNPDEGAEPDSPLVNPSPQPEPPTNDEPPQDGYESEPVFEPESEPVFEPEVVPEADAVVE